MEHDTCGINRCRLRDASNANLDQTPMVLVSDSGEPEAMRWYNQLKSHVSSHQQELHRPTARPRLPASPEAQRVLGSSTWTVRVSASALLRRRRCSRVAVAVRVGALDVGPAEVEDLPEDSGGCWRC